MTILYVDDHHAERTVFAEVLRNAGHTALESATLADAEHVAGRQRGPIDLLIIEAVLTTANGRDIAERLTATRAATKVLYVSEHSGAELQHDRLLPAGAAFLQKPFAAEQLIRKINEMAGARRRAAS